MIRTDLLKERIASQGLTQAKVAAMLGLTTRTFYKRMRTGVFRSDEMESMARILHIEDTSAIYVFGDDVGCGLNDGDMC